VYEPDKHAFYVEACRELDKEFPEARLLPAGSWSLGLSPKMKRDLGKLSWDDRVFDRTDP
jgi:hypothetical protein